MLEVVLTLDYEIHGNGQGSPAELMVEPTARMLRQFDRHGAKLTVMADTVEIMRFRRHASETGRDDYAHAAIADQLRTAVATGHDVQLHLHPAYANATLADGGWQLDYSRYDLAGLPYELADEFVRDGKAYLEELLRPVDPSYECVGFRAANWSMQPSAAIVRALLGNGFRADTSVFKHGRRAGIVNFDYRDAHSELVPWRVDPRDICAADREGRLLEIPIYCESRPIHRFLNVGRLHRVLQSRRHPVPNGGGVHEPADPGDGHRRAPAARIARATSMIGSRHAWKLDFNQCSGRQLIAGLERAARHPGAVDGTLPLVLIGHSKLYSRFNERQLEPFLAHVAAHPERVRFATLRGALPAAAAAA